MESGHGNVTGSQNKGLMKQIEIDPNLMDFYTKVAHDYNKSQSTPQLPDLDPSFSRDIAGKVAGVVSTIADQELAPLKVPKGHLGETGCENLWIAGQVYPIVEWIAPEQTAVKAYDDYLCINGYYQDGRLIDLSGSKFMPRKNFSYVKTVNANINGELGIYKTAIEAAFNSGIRFWNKDLVAQGSVGDYQDSIITGNTPR